ncbi:MAG TPA: hypothetical protein ACFYEK_16265 [Candidatus Wunengus sp. YC60]|uniref:hypothetical protein n=1 Tax=Candidatus Wunengus sp. YC60 TaxID=3367697 RepID=UPI004027328F
MSLFQKTNINKPTLSYLCDAIILSSLYIGILLKEFNLFLKIFPYHYYNLKIEHLS